MVQATAGPYKCFNVAEKSGERRQTTKRRFGLFSAEDSKIYPLWKKKCPLCFYTYLMQNKTKCSVVQNAHVKVIQSHKPTSKTRLMFTNVSGCSEVCPFFVRL